MLRIAKTSMVSDKKVMIVAPFELWVVKPTRATMREHSDVPAAARMLQRHGGIVAAKKPSTVTQLCLLAVL
jgi:hypothetical protein